VSEDYSADIIKTLIARDVSTTPNPQKALTPKNFLSRHNIKDNLRAKMVDWMIEVLCSYKCKDQTFFLSVNFMDRYLENHPDSMEPENIHLLGISAMFLAAKYEEIYPFKMRHVYEKIGHRKLSKKKVKDQEAEICYTLDFNLSAVTSFDFAMNALAKINVEKSLQKKDMKYLIKLVIYLSKMNIYDY
jgi:hypothetical protein